MKPHGIRSHTRPPQVVPDAPSPRPDSHSVSGEPSYDPEATLQQLEKVVSEFMMKYPSHTQRIPSIRPGEHPMIAFVRSMAASMAAKEEELEKLNSEALEAAREKERFLANMSHEVRTPMNGIFGMVNLLLEMDLDADQREYLETVQSSSESLLNVLDDILDYAKLNSNQMQLRPRQFRLHKLLGDVLRVYQTTATSKGVELSGVLCESLPDEFVGDDLRLKQVLSNLVSNAIKFTHEGSVTVSVQPMQKTGRQQLLVEIRDTGVGIDEKCGRNLFTPFRQVDSEDDHRYDGTGLGLAISKNLVELMGGRIWFESKVDEGTAFFFTVDIEPARPDESDPASSDPVRRCKIPPPGDDGGQSEKPRVLLVEDDKVNQKVARLTLQQLGCEVTVAGDGREALDLADGPVTFDLVCMDVNMPVMNGLKSTAAIRQLDHPNARCHILAMTGMAFDEDREKCLEAGMDDIVTKPFDLEDLRQRLESVRASRGERVVLVS